MAQAVGQQPICSTPTAIGGTQVRPPATTSASAPRTPGSKAALDTFTPSATCRKATAYQFLPKGGTEILGGLMLGDDPRVRQEVLEKIAGMRARYGDAWDPVGSTRGSGSQLTFSQDVLKACRGDEAVIFSAEASNVFIRHTADHRTINGVWGPAANDLIFRTGGDLGYARQLNSMWTVRGDVLGGVNVLTLRADPDDGFSSRPNSTAIYVGWRVSISRPRLGGFIQVDQDLNGPLKGYTRGTAGIVYHLNRPKVGT